MLYGVRWPNGDFSVVAANSKEDAAFMLDEFGPVEPKNVVRLKHFMMDFSLMDDGHLSLAGIGEECDGEIMSRFYPLIDKALGEDEDGEDGYQQAVAAAVPKERERVSEDGWVDEADDRQGLDWQALSGCSRSVLERIRKCRQ